ncbi:C4-dicarboxylate ABC transporter permease [Tamilnaduibacter salinus]|uniref:TRAP transporter small permease protein n=1 Tax=Tamilnaduibacter salinus TaxID=1484056 RepID=A0A2A2I1V6_9GAMM|nr:TRAP transporter small permease subunit [Tamilnaduibacter salinus]PAV25296.1 C4-dicarboxylate ABC transporter permease [Tamilnaduibacter salinus]
MPEHDHNPTLYDENATIVGEVAEASLHHHTELPQTSASQKLDQLLIWVGKSASWLWLATVAVIIWAVIGRYAFGSGSVTLEEWQWHIAGTAWLLGLAYTLATDDHVRVDVIHERLSIRAQARIELLGLVVLLLPFLGLALYEMTPYAISSFSQGETSQSPAGLSHRWILKSVVALSFALLILAALSRLLRVTALLFGFPKPIQTHDNKRKAA